MILLVLLSVLGSVILSRYWRWEARRALDMELRVLFRAAQGAWIGFAAFLVMSWLFR